MLRSKQLLPLAKGARAWIVAGSVSKPAPLDATVNPGGSEDGRPEQSYSGTKSSHSAKSPPHICRAKDSPFRGDAKRPGAPSSGSKFEKSPGSAFVPESFLSRKADIAVVPVPGKDMSSITLHSSSVKHDLVDNSRPADSAAASLSPIAPWQTGKTAKPLDAKSGLTGTPIPFVVGKVGEVGFAGLSHISEQESTSSHARISGVKRLEAESSVVSPLSRTNKSTDNVIHSTRTSDEVVSMMTNVGDEKVIQSSPSLNSATPVERSKLPLSVGSNTPFGCRNKNACASEGIVFGTVDAPVVHFEHLCNPNAEVLLHAGARQLVGKQAQSDVKGVRPEPEGVTDSAGLGPVTVSQKASRSSKGKEVSTGVYSNGRRANSFTQTGCTQQSQRSRKDSSASSDIVDQVRSILKRMGWTPQTMDALASFNSRLSAFHINEVLKHQRELGLAWEFFSWAKSQNGYKHDVRTYTTMIGILGRERKFEACDKLLNDMRKEGCEPSVVTFNRLIHSYGRANYLGEALNLFHSMQEAGCEPDRVTYCTLIDLHSKAGFHNTAMDICQQMWEAGFEPDTFSYTLIIHCLGKAGNLPGAYKLFLEMIDSGHTPNLVTYNTMIDLLAKAGKHHMALKLYNDMQDSGYRPDNVTYSVIMEVLGHSGHMDEAENVFFEMEQAGWTADATTFGSLVYMWGEIGNVEKATEWYKRMLHSGLLPNVPTCNSLLWVYMKANDYEAAGEVLGSMPKWGLCPTLPTYTLLLSSCTTCDNQQDVDSTLQIMSRTGHLAHSFLCQLLNEIDARESTVHAHQFFDGLHEEEHESKRSFADALIEFLYKLDHKERAGNVWEVAVEKNLYPSAISQRAPNYWIVDLHVMSMGTAVVALLRTLSSLRERMLATGVVPHRIEIVTGWGRHSKVSGFSKIKNVVDSILGALHAPFYVDNSNVGCFVGSGEKLAHWLQEPDMAKMLAL